jgi:hypothetical protein
MKYILLHYAYYNIFFQFSFSSNSELTDKQSSGSNFQRSNWQKVQFSTDLLKQWHR